MTLFAENVHPVKKQPCNIIKLSKTILLSILILNIFTSFSQEDTSKIAFIAYWSVGDSYDFRITKIKKSWKSDELVKSSDDTYIANISKFYGAEVPFLRPKKLSNDRASSVDVALHALKKIKANKNDIFILLQPTSPLRNTSHIDNALKIFEKNRFVENVVGISKLDHPIEWSNTVPKNLSMRCFAQKGNSNKRSQDYAPRYLINGSIYILKIRSFFKNRNFILKNNSYGYIMKKNESIDIDNLEDLKLAEYFLKQNNI